MLTYLATFHLSPFVDVNDLESFQPNQPGNPSVFCIIAATVNYVILIFHKQCSSDLVCYTNTNVTINT